MKFVLVMSIYLIFFGVVGVAVDHDFFAFARAPLPFPFQNQDECIF